MQVALEKAGASGITFCGGRVDADNPSEAPLEPRQFPNDPSGIQKAKDDILVQGLTFREGVALAGRPRSAVLQAARGYTGSWAVGKEISTLTNAFFSVLLDNEWERVPDSGTGMAESDPEYRSLSGAEGQPARYVMQSDLAIRHDPTLRAIAMEFASDEDAFLEAFASGWNKLMNADRFDGPDGNLCDATEEPFATA